MSNLTKRLKAFENRVRIVRSWLGLAIGACVGTIVSTIWAVLDWRSVVYTEWSWMGALTGVCAILGAGVGLALRVPAQGLAQSIDRRAGLEDRLTTAHERTENADVFDGALQTDAEERLSMVRPKVVYPFQVGKWHGGALLFGLIAAGIFILGNTPIGLSDEARKDRAELKKLGETVKRVTKENFETPEAKEEMSPEEKRLADQLRRFDRDLEKAHVSKEDALQKSNELAQKADELMQNAAKASEQNLAQAESAREQLEKGELEKAGLGDMSLQMAQMSAGERQDKLNEAKRHANELKNRLEELKRRLDEINRKLLNKNLTPEERKALEAQKAGIEKQISQLNTEMRENSDMQKALELSREAQEVFRKMTQDPMYKELIEIEKKLAQNSSSAKNSGHPKLTDEERKEMKEALERLAAQLKDEKAMKAYLAALLEAMKKANQLGRCNGAGIGISGLASLPTGMASAGPGAPTEDIWQGDTGQIHKLDKPEASRGTTTTDVISGDQRPATGRQSNVEIRAPSTVGNRTSVPYRDVLPSYEKKAESALNRQQIPKEHQKRVKQYFDSLTGAHRN